MNYSILKCAAYTLIHTPDMVLHNGTTQTMEKLINPDSSYLQNIKRYLRDFESVLSYPPNQCYIGNITPDELKSLGNNWIDSKVDPKRQGNMGEIIPQDEFICMMKICDVFELVYLEENFCLKMKDKIGKSPIFQETDMEKINGISLDSLEKIIKEDGCEELYNNDVLVGCVKRAHDIDVNLDAHTIFENLVVKASGVIALRELLHIHNINPKEIDYIIECSEEACGDMNQRGGGNFAKAIGEFGGLVNATGSDLRGFCAAPTHALINAASLVSSGTYKNVVVVAGGATAKLGMNGKDHVKRELPILEDVLGGFAFLVSENDGVSPIIRTDLVGKHNVGTGSSPQAVMNALISLPLEKANLKITDVDRYSVEMQNPDITKNAGAGDVPEGNYKMIGAIGVKRGDILREDIPFFMEKHGMCGWAPTQGHIPSGVPYLGFAQNELTFGDMNRVMIIGKGSLFLGRMTNLFDGVSVILERNNGEVNSSHSNNSISNTLNQRKKIKIGVTTLGSEHGFENIIEGVISASKDRDIEIILIGPKSNTNFLNYEVKNESEAHKKMEELLDNGTLDACVTMHYTFPLGVTTIGKLITPSKGKEIYIASTTGLSSTDKNSELFLNAIYGNIVAKACGLNNPTIGILNIDGAKNVERNLKELIKNGYDVSIAASGRMDGDLFMRGNDVLAGTADVLVCDSLTGNILTKILSAYSTGGNYESLGFGYGPGIGFNYKRNIFIVSRASGASVIKGAIEYAVDTVKGNLQNIIHTEFEKIKNSEKFQQLTNFNKENFNDNSNGNSNDNSSSLKKEVVTCEISGIDVMDLDSAVELLKSNGIYSESGMGCTGPIILVNPSKVVLAKEILIKGSFIS